MRKWLCMLLAGLLALPMAGLAEDAAARLLPFTGIELGMSLPDAQLLEPDLDALYLKDGRAQLLYGAPKNDLGVAGELQVTLAYDAADVDAATAQAMVGGIEWQVYYVSAEPAVEAGSTLMYNSASPGDDARALYQRLADSVTAGLGAGPVATEGADPGAGQGAFTLTQTWRGADGASISCTLYFEPDCGGWAEYYQVYCAAQRQ